MGLRWPVIAVIGLALTGCGWRNSSVSGTVRYRGQPLPSGTVVFHDEAGRTGHSMISKDGRYSIDDAPLGPVHITVRSHPAMPTHWPTTGKAPPTPAPAGVAPQEKEKRDGKYTRIPPRYADPAKSGLIYTVRAGSQAHDIELAP